MVKKADIPRHVIDTAMKLAAERGWRDLSLAEIADAAKLPLSKVYPVFPSKTAILGAFTRQIDAAVLEAAEIEAGEAGAREAGLGADDGAQDRLFDALMRRFDALRPYREALGNIVWAEAGDPASALCGLCRLKRSMACMLEAARLSTTGLRGALRVKALALAYLATLRVFLRDDSPDLAATMAALDRNLSRLGRLARLCSRTRYRPADVSQET